VFQHRRERRGQHFFHQSLSPVSRDCFDQLLPEKQAGEQSEERDPLACPATVKSSSFSG
jgi:hypothetical protein